MKMPAGRAMAGIFILAESVGRLGEPPPCRSGQRGDVQQRLSHPPDYGCFGWMTGLKPARKYREMNTRYSENTALYVVKI